VHSDLPAAFTFCQQLGLPKQFDTTELSWPGNADAFAE
jgi:hypothetical protein